MDLWHSYKEQGRTDVDEVLKPVHGQATIQYQPKALHRRFPEIEPIEDSSAHACLTTEASAMQSTSLACW